MGFFKRLIDFLTLGSDRPVRRLFAYYMVLGGVIYLLIKFVPVADRTFGGTTERETAGASQVLQDGLGTDSPGSIVPDLPPRIEMALSTTIIILSTMALMLPVCWVYMSTRSNKGQNQSVAQTLLFLPIVVTGIVLVVQNSLALAFSLAGVVAAVRFRTTLRDARDVVFIFLAIMVGFAAGVELLIVGAIVSVIFNFILILSWRYDFGRTALEPTASSQWAEPLQELADARTNGKVPDRDLVLALGQKQAAALADRFERVRRILGPSGKKPRFNAVLSVSTEKLTEAQEAVAGVLDEMVGRWRLDEVITNTAKPSELYYLVRVRKSIGRDDLLTAVRAKGGQAIINADVEVSAPAEDAEEKEKK